MRLAVPIAIVALAAALLGGCGGSSSGSESTAPDLTSPAVAESAPEPQTSEGGAPPGASAAGCETEATDAEALSATAVSCEEARGVMLAWQREAGCAAGAGASHSACTVRSYRCIATRTDRGLAVSCARPGHSIAFIAKS